MCLGTQSSTHDSRAHLLPEYLKPVWMSSTKKASGILEIDGLEFSGIVFQFL